MTDMRVKFKCPHCQTSLEAGSKLIGKKGKCPNCGNEITVPEKQVQIPNNEKETPRKE